MIIGCINYGNIEPHRVHPDVINLYTLICVSPANEKANLGHDLQLFQFLRVSCLASTPRAATPSKFRGGRSSRGSKLAPPQVDLTGRQQVSHAFTWSDIFLDDWRDANQVLDLSYRWLKSEEAIPNGIGWHSHVLRLERCDFFLGKLTMGLLSRKRESKSWKQAQNNKIWIHIRYASKTSHTDP